VAFIVFLFIAFVVLTLLAAAMVSVSVLLFELLKLTSLSDLTCVLLLRAGLCGSSR